MYIYNAHHSWLLAAIVVKTSSTNENEKYTINICRDKKAVHSHLPMSRHWRFCLLEARQLQHMAAGLSPNDTYVYFCSSGDTRRIQDCLVKQCVNKQTVTLSFARITVYAGVALRHIIWFYWNARQLLRVIKYMRLCNAVVMLRHGQAYVVIALTVYIV